MNKKLAKILISKNILKLKHEIDTYYISESFTEKKYREHGIFFITEFGEDTFTACSAVDGKFVISEYENITHIEGMTPERFALAFDINPDGSNSKKRKKYPVRVNT